MLALIQIETWKYSVAALFMCECVGLVLGAHRTLEDGASHAAAPLLSAIHMRGGESRTKCDAQSTAHYRQ